MQNGIMLNIAKWYRGFIQGKTRIVSAWVFAFIIGFFAKNDPILPGIILCFLGATLRFWASGYLRKDNQLSVGGPYAYTRNPLYLGTYFIALGALLAIQAWITLALLTVVFALIYHYIILDEENKLKKMFGAPYEGYCNLVNRFFPSLLPAPKAERLKLITNSDNLKFSFDIAWKKNKAYEAYLSFIGIIAYIYLASYVWHKII